MPDTTANDEHDDTLADDEEVEEQRDSMAEEALVMLFIAAVLMTDDDDPALEASVRSWLTRWGRRIAALYLAGVLARAGQDAIDTVVNPDDFEASDSVVGWVLSLVKRLRKAVREGMEPDADGRSITPEEAAHATANAAHGRLTEDVAATGMFDLPNGESIQKMWMSRLDNRVRPLHMRLTWQSRKLGEDFWRWPETGQVLAFPGDPRAPLDATANCRCFLILSVK